ncbi:MAG: endonuclease III [Alphaproteobacteria bacterium]|nr:endonuclease III [Alphaproteobacteria bacterium]
MTHFYPHTYEFFERLQKRNPHPETELTYTDPYTLLVAVVLSAQSTDKGVNKATESLFQVANTPEKMVDLGIEGLKKYIKTIGLYNNKAKNIIGLSRLLIERHNGQVPSDRISLEALPGVGRKSANVVLSVAFHQDTFPVDTHMFRVCNRTGLAPGKTPKDVERTLEAIVPPPFRHHAHHWIVLHGRYICTAIKPKCMICPISDLCDYYQTRAQCAIL